MGTMSGFDIGLLHSKVLGFEAHQKTARKGLHKGQRSQQLLFKITSGTYGGVLKTPSVGSDLIKDCPTAKPTVSPKDSTVATTCRYG